MNTHTEPFLWRKIALQLLVALNLALGITLWRSQPDQSWSWLIGMLSLPLFWGLATGFNLLGKDKSPQYKQRIYNALLTAGVLLAGAFISVTASTLEWLPDDWSGRYGMLTSALILVIVGNGLPKQVEAGCPRSRSLSLQRLLGWTFVIHGLILLGIWLLPMSHSLANTLSLGVYSMFILFCCVGGIIVWRRQDMH